MAELAFGEAKGQPGTVILLTVGTGIGSALISDGRLVPNTEFGHLIMRSKASETLVSGAARVRRGLGWKRWAREFNEYLAMLEFFFWPDRIILGGGVSKESKSYWPYLSTEAELVKARFLNSSGIIGAAYAAGLAVHHAGQASGQRFGEADGHALGQLPAQAPGQQPAQAPGQAPEQGGRPEQAPARPPATAGSAQPRG
jgi:polyphosphate glucokinase